MREKCCSFRVFFAYVFCMSFVHTRGGGRSVNQIEPNHAGIVAGLGRMVAGRRISAYSGGMAKQTSKGPGQRQLRVGEMIRRCLSEILSRGEIHDPVFDTMPITIGEVSVSSDLKVATVFVMPLMGSGNVDLAIEALARHKGILRKKVSEEVILRYAVELRFKRDETFDRLDETRRMFSNPTVMRDVAAKVGDDANPEDGVDDPMSDA